MNRLVILGLVFTSATAGAQSDTSSGPRDTVLARARTMVQNGRDAEGRRLIDSVFKAAAPESDTYSEALYWRAVLAPTAADAERDYRRLLIETPLAPRAGDAMLQLAQLEQARGDRRAAADHMQRFLLTNPASPERPRVSLSLVRLLFDISPPDLARACEAYRMGNDIIPRDRIEMRNQLDFYGPRCADFAAAQSDSVAKAKADSVAAQAAADSVAAADSAAAARKAKAKTQTAKPRAESREPRAENGFYSVQLAAYDSPQAARRFAKMLKDRGVDARVDGSTAPYRVRVGKFKTRAAALKVAQDLKAQGNHVFVTLVK